MAGWISLGINILYSSLYEADLSTEFFTSPFGLNFSNYQNSQYTSVLGF